MPPTTYGLAPRSRHSAVARRLKNLPPELVHQVISDLELPDILELICTHDIPYIEQCISSHINYGTLLSPTNLPVLKQYFTLHLDLSCQRRRSSTPQIDFINRGITYPDLLTNVQAAIVSDLMIYEEYLPALNEFSTSYIPHAAYWDMSSCEALRNLWERLAAAEEKMNAAKSAQLTRLVGLLVAHPGMLRQCYDNSQEQRSKSYERHCISYLEFLVKDMLKPQVLSGKFVARALFRRHRFPWVPYDKYLRMFLGVLKRYPLKEDIEKTLEALEEKTKRRQKNVRESRQDAILHRQQRAISKLRKPYPYPTDISRSISKTIEGMGFLCLRIGEEYFGNPPEARTIFLRTNLNFPRWSMRSVPSIPTRSCHSRKGSLNGWRRF
ncbi:hypothetical protein K440DRAFT_611848 [Wilcoxina mikolae CBS 423.85]|nr:hypothetical protein K440DRAFT_611848 [Wilcoxina mikolae CBS 423.85]